MECRHKEKACINAGESITANEIVVFTYEVCGICDKILSVAQTTLPVEVSLQI